MYDERRPILCRIWKTCRKRLAQGLDLPKCWLRRGQKGQYPRGGDVVGGSVELGGIVIRDCQSWRQCVLRPSTRPKALHQHDGSQENTRTAALLQLPLPGKGSLSPHFNFLQLSFIPDSSQFDDLEAQGLHAFVGLLRSMNESCYGYKSDIPEMSDLYDVAVKEGDLVICGTDGLFDNLFDMEISSLVSDCLSPYEVDILRDCDELTKAWFEGQFMHPLAVEPPTLPRHTPPGAIARALVQAAFARSMDPQASTPFGRNARKEGHRDLSTGGKLDDISVVAAWIRR